MMVPVQWLVAKPGVATKLLEKEPLALYTHCYGHALNLAIQETVKSNVIIRDTLDTVEEMTKLIKKHQSVKGYLKSIMNRFQWSHQEYPC